MANGSKIANNRTITNKRKVASKRKLPTDEKMAPPGFEPGLGRVRVAKPGASPLDQRVSWKSLLVAGHQGSSSIGPKGEMAQTEK